MVLDLLPPSAFSAPPRQGLQKKENSLGKRVRTEWNVVGLKGHAGVMLNPRQLPHWL